MSLLSSRDLLGLNVQTESGERLGKIIDFDVDAESHHVVVYHIKSAKLIVGLFRETLMIRPEQVIAISTDAMIVADSVVKEQKSLEAKPQPL